MNRYPAWKYLLVVAVLIVGIVYALPNLFGESPAVQVSSARMVVDQSTLGELERTLGRENIPYDAIHLEEGQILARFRDTDAQLSARDAIQEELGRDYVVALSLAPDTPSWLRVLGAEPMHLGLDLRGGVHFLIQVDMDEAIQIAEERFLGDIRGLLRDQRIRYADMDQLGDGGLFVVFRNAEDRDRAEQIIAREFRDLRVNAVQRDGEPAITARLTDDARTETRQFALQQNITTLRNRVDELGVAEPVISQQGQDRIVVQLPGVQDTARAKDILGATATLEFRFRADGHDPREVAETSRIPPGTRLYQDRDGNPVLLEARVILTGDHIADASSGFDQRTGSPNVSINLDGQGARAMRNATRDNVGRFMGTVFIETLTETRTVNGETVRETETVEEVINVARIREQLGRRFQITGLESSDEAHNLALLLRAGALAVPMHIVEERTVGPSLGQDNINQGFQSVVIGFLLVLAFIGLWYRVFGLVANLALAFNLVVIVAVMSMLQATLTLPGIAGIVLTVGMAVDANVLIFERIREELKNGNSPHASINAGYAKALSTIADANITTLIAAILLFAFGTGPIRGFAVTLSIGIATSMFTAIVGTRAVINLIYGGRRLQRLSI